MMLNIHKSNFICCEHFAVISAEIWIGLRHATRVCVWGDSQFMYPRTFFKNKNVFQVTQHSRKPEKENIFYAEITNISTYSRSAAAYKFIAILATCWLEKKVKSHTVPSWNFQPKFFLRSKWTTLPLADDEFNKYISSWSAWTRKKINESVINKFDCNPCSLCLCISCWHFRPLVATMQ